MTPNEREQVRAASKELSIIIEICDGTRGPEDFELTPFETILLHAKKSLAILDADSKPEHVTENDREDAHQVCLDYEQCGFEEAARTISRIRSDAFEAGKQYQKERQIADAIARTEGALPRQIHCMNTYGYVYGELDLLAGEVERLNSVYPTP